MTCSKSQIVRCPEGLWERSARLPSLPKFLQAFAVFPLHLHPSLFLLTGQVGLGWPGCSSTAGVRTCFGCARDGEEADLRPGPELSFPRSPHPPGGWMPSGPFRPRLAAMALAGRRRLGNRRRGSFRGPAGPSGVSSLLPAAPSLPPTPPARSGPAATRMRRALLAPSLLRAALSPWQPRHDEVARARGLGADRAGPGGTGAGCG